jgi:hypothetical protein
VLLLTQKAASNNPIKKGEQSSFFLTESVGCFIC